MKKTSNIFNSFLNAALAFSLTSMAILVFGNVVLRYVFNSGITWSEEMSRFLFIWLTFIGAIGALKDKEHLGVDLLVKKLSDSVKKVCFLISNLLILGILWLVLNGSWEMTLLNMDSKAPATGMPLSYVFGIGIVMSVLMSIIIVFQIYRFLFSNPAAQEEKLLKLQSLSQTTEGGQKEWHS